MRLGQRSAILCLAIFAFQTLPFSREAHSSTAIDDRARFAAQQERRIWVFLSDKGPDAAVRAKRVVLPPRTTERIQLRGGNFDPQMDVPVYPSYRSQLEKVGVLIKYELSWLNAVTGWIHTQDLSAVAALPFVDSLVPVATYRRSLPEEQPSPPPQRAVEGDSGDVFDYGLSREQIALIQVHELHRLGLTGRGVRIGFLDTGYSLGIAVFDSLDLRGTRDFINDDVDVGDDDPAQMGHGTQTLSLCGGLAQGELIGVAPHAEYVVAKTEQVSQEIRAEEDDWVAGLLWLDTMGCDIVSSSLGYTDWYVDEEFDGNTAKSTIEADLAAARGMLVVNAAGNAGCLTGQNRLIAPADGDSVLTIGASDFNGELVSFSSCGPTADGRIKPDVIAPGQRVRTAVPVDTTYRAGSGTSFSTPLVSGVCALLLQQDPSLSPYDLIDRLRRTADHACMPLPTYGWGLVQAASAAGIVTDSGTHDQEDPCAEPGQRVELWPNPARSETVISVIGGEVSEGVFRVFTVSGTLVYQGELVAGRGVWGGQTLGDETASPAVYLIHVSTEYVDEVVKLAWLPHE